MKKLTLSETVLFGGGNPPPQLAAEYWFDDACILDMDSFVKTLASVKAKEVRPDLIGSIIVHYATKWLPDLSDLPNDTTQIGGEPALSNFDDPSSPKSVTALWMKKRFFVETLVGILPPEKDAVPCNFLLRLLRTASMVGAEPEYQAELETKVAWQLDQASLKELMIPSFSHTCGTLLDVGLVMRLVKKFVGLEEGAARNGLALVKVAKLVDSYLAEAAVDSGLSAAAFVALASTLPSHARSMDDGLYRAVDTYLKAHPNVSKHERKSLCRLMDIRKLSPEASVHASQNERLPVRAVVQVLFSEQTKLSRTNLDWSGSFTGHRSPNSCGGPMALDLSSRCLSKREAAVQQVEIRRLKEEVQRLQGQCNAMQAQIERMVEKKKGFFRWKKLGLMPSSLIRNGMSTGVVSEKTTADDGDAGAGEIGFGRFTPVDIKTRLVKGRTPPPKWRRKSMS